ncbi:MAG TPA: ATP-binding protein [Vicinamibacterales bacterium]|nr:ATP-binding protein [Vicinamibacterales bacterium]
MIFVGLPASGKTTFYQRRFAGTHQHISKDLWPRTSNQDRRQAELMRLALSQGLPVVIDNTNPALADRAPVIALARQLGARVIGYYFTATTGEAIGRNRGREGKARVPDVAIFARAKRMAKPRLEEGFDELYAVSIDPSGDFSVQPMTVPSAEA